MERVCSEVDGKRCSKNPTNTGLLSGFSEKDQKCSITDIAVTSHGSQGLTADRVLINIDTAVNPQLINSRFAYVSVSRAAIAARIFTNDSSGLAQNLEHDVAKTSAVDFFQSANHGLSDTGLGENL